MYYKIIRQPPDGKSVRGKLYRTLHYYNKRKGEMVERLYYICDTLENADYMIPALIYKITVTMSPKFKRLLPVLEQVPGRTGIRVHRGTKPEHSRGCILVSGENETVLTNLWLNEQHGKEETRIEICAS